MSEFTYYERDMMHRIAFLLLILALCFTRSSEAGPFSAICEEIEPYLLPEQHPMYPVLEKIFKASRVTFSENTMASAGFDILYSKKRSFIRVARHAELPGYLIKANLDTVLNIKNEKAPWQWFVLRCQGVQKVHHVIDSHKIRHFQAPRKWIYLLPEETIPLSNQALNPQPVILLVEDMDLVSREENRRAWKEQITKRHLKEFYTVIKEAGGSSYRPDNVWLSRNGKFSFIDTEYPNRKGKFTSIRSYLSKENQRYWDRLTKD